MGCEEEGEETTVRAGPGKESLTPSWNITANITRSEKSHEIKDLTAGAQSREGPTEEKQPTGKAINQSTNQRLLADLKEVYFEERTGKLPCDVYGPANGAFRFSFGRTG